MDKWRSAPGKVSIYSSTAPLPTVAAWSLKYWVNNRESMRTFSDNRILETILQDVYYAVRILRQNPLFVTTAVLTLALAIGGNTAMFTIIRSTQSSPVPRFR
jgi:hypothetical protein